MHAMVLLAAMSAYSAETTFASMEEPQRQSAEVSVASSSWEWSGVFDWLRVPVGFLLRLR